MLCLHTEEPTVVNRRFELHLPKSSNRLRRIRILKQPSRYHIHTHIRTLRRQNHRDEELERCLEREGGLCIRIEFPQNAQLLCLDGFRYSHTQFVSDRVGAGIRPPRAMNAAELNPLRTGTIGE